MTASPAPRHLILQRDMERRNGPPRLRDNDDECTKLQPYPAFSD